MSHLKSIIAVNSYAPSRINQYKVDGGCLIQGTNGVGKTSLLRLSAIFFGVKPGDIALISGKNNRFADYYLKTPSSYVVFEYEKSGLDLLVIAYSKEGNDLTYQFCDGAFEESLFLDTNKRFIPFLDLKSHIQSTTSRRLSNQFSWSQYKDIIQSGIRKTGGGKDAQAINEAKIKYSLCEPNRSVLDIDKVVSSILSNKPSLQSVRSLIAHEIIGLEDMISHSGVQREFEPQELMKQRKLLRQAESFMQKRDLLAEMQKNDALIADLDKEMSDLKGAALFSLEHFSESLLSLEQEANTLSHRLDSLRNTYNADRDAAQTALSSNQGDLEDTLARLKILDEQRKLYDQKDVKGKALLANEMESLKQQLDAQKKIISEIQTHYENIVQRYKEKLEALRNEIQKLKNAAREEQVIQTEELNTKSADMIKEFNLSRDRLSQTYLDEKDRLKGILGELSILKGKKETESKNPFSEETKRLSASIEILQKKIGDGQSDLANALKAVSELTSVQTELEKERAKKLQNIEATKDEEKKLQLKREDYLKSLAIIEKMTYFKMRAIDPSQADMALRALNIELLKKPIDGDLPFSPGQNTLLGFELDCSDVPAVEILEKAQLERVISDTEQALLDNKEKQESLGAEASVLNGKISDLDKSIIESRAKVQQIEATLSRQQKEIGQEKHKLSIELDKLKQGCKDEIANIEIEIDKVKTSIVDLQQRYHSDLSALESDHNNSQTEIKGEIKKAKERYSTEEKRLDDQLEAEEKALKELEMKDLSDAGARTEEYKQQQEVLHNLQKRYKTALEAAELLNGYHRWLEQEYSRHENLNSKKAELSSLIHELQNKLNALKTHFDVESKKIAELQSQNESASKHAKNEITTLEAILTSFLAETPSPSQKPSVIIPSSELKGKVSGRIGHRKAYLKSGQEACHRILSSLKQTKELEDNFSEALVQQGLNDFNSAINWRSHIQPLGYLMGEYTSDLIALIRQRYQILSQRLIDLNTRLDDQARRIRDKGREISAKMNEAGSSFSKIESVSAAITSNIDNIGFKKSLAAAAQEASLVQQLSEHEAPRDSYYELVSVAIGDIHRYGKELQIENFIDIEVAVKNRGHTDTRIARNDKELSNIDSEGLSFLILVSLYMAIKNTFEKGKDVTLLWPIDELGKLHHDNIEVLMSILKREHVELLCAEPSTNPKVLSLFKHIYEIMPSGKIIKPESKTKDSAASMLINVLGEVGV
ncbi:ATP-binding protein [Thiomicrorhabdus cannonii]|uniref:ATP-binding protein n=1 Tax=Thiomicrorhabdus cannonii TaxID=2748011 RepID=UPI0015BA2292